MRGIRLPGRRTRRLLGMGAFAAILLGWVGLTVAPNDLGPSVPSSATAAATSDHDTAGRDAKASSFSGPLSVKVPTEAMVGTSWPIAVGGAPPGAAVQIVVGWGALRQTVFDATASAEGTAQVTVGAQSSTWAGVTRVTALAQGHLGAATINLTPQPLINPLDSTVGPRSEVADTIDSSELVLLPVDQFGNGPVDGLSMTLHRTHPDGTTTSSTVRTHHLLAQEYLPSGTLAGVNQVHMTSDDLTGPQVTLREAPGPPVDFEVKVDSLVPDADGRSLLHLVTTQLSDRYGNVQRDGTAVTLTAAAPDGDWVLNGVVVDGRATFVTAAPVAPGTMEFVGWCRGQKSKSPLRVTFTSAGVTIPIRTARTATRLSVDVGPVVNRQGAMVADGTKVTASVRYPGVLASSAPTVEGMAHLDLIVPASMDHSTIAVQVLGGQAQVAIS